MKQKQNHVKVRHHVIGKPAQYKSPLMLNLEFNCALKSEKERSFPVISTSKRDITNLFYPNTKLKTEPGCQNSTICTHE